MSPDPREKLRFLPIGAADAIGIIGAAETEEIDRLTPLRSKTLAMEEACGRAARAEKASESMGIQVPDSGEYAEFHLLRGDSNLTRPHRIK